MAWLKGEWRDSLWHLVVVVVEDVKDGGMGASETKSRRGIRPLSICCLICCLVSRREGRRRRG